MVLMPVATSLDRKNKDFAWSFSVIGVLILISLLNWFLFHSYAVRVYYAVIPALLAIQVLFNNMIEYLLVVKAGNTRWFSILVSPGTILHELSHAAAAVITGCKVTSISLFHFDKNTGVLGSVTYTSPPSRLSFIRDLTVAFAPFYGCSFAVVFIAKYVFNQAITTDALQVNLAGVFQAVSSSLGMFIIQYTQILSQSPLLSVILYLQLCFAFGAAPSGFDFQGIVTSARRNLTGLVLAASTVILAALLIEYAPQLGDYGMILSDFLTIALDWTVFLLLLSTTLLLFSLTLLYSSSMWLEAGMFGKIASPIVFIGVYVISLSWMSKTPALMAAWLLSLSMLYLFRNPHVFVKKKSG